MPICSYIVYPTPGEKGPLADRLDSLSECEVDRATNRDLLLLMTETSDLSHQKQLEEKLKSFDGIQSFAQTFGEILPEEGEVPNG